MADNKKKVVAGRVGTEKFYYDEKGNIVDSKGKPASASVVRAFLAGIEDIPAPNKPATGAPKKIKTPTSGGTINGSGEQVDRQQAKGPGSLDSTIQKLGKSVASAAASPVKNVASLIGADIKRQTVGNFSPKAIISSTLSTLGLNKIVKAGKPDTQVGGGRTGGGPGSLIGIVKNIDETLSEILNALGTQFRLSKFDRRKVKAAAPEGGGVEGGKAGGDGKKTGGILGSLGSVFEGLMGFLEFINAPLLLLVGVLASLKAADWAKMFGHLTKLFDDLAQGKWFDALLEGIASIGGTLLTGLGRLVAIILDSIGFTDTAKSLNDWLDSHDIGQMYIDFVHNAWQFIKDAFNTTVDTVKKWIDASFKIYDDIIQWFTDTKDYIVGAFDDAVNTVKKWINTAFKIADDIIQWFVDLKDDIVGAFNDATDVVKSWIDSTFKLADNIIGWFSKLKDDTVALFTGFSDDITTWWKNFDIVTTITDTFQKVQDMVTNYFASVGNRISGAFTDMGKAITGWVTSLIPDWAKKWLPTSMGGTPSEPPAQEPTAPHMSFKEAQIAMKAGSISEEQLAKVATDRNAGGEVTTAQPETQPLSAFDTSSDNIVDLLEQIRLGKNDGTIPPGNAKEAIAALKQGNIKLAKMWMDVSKDTTGGDPFSGEDKGGVGAITPAQNQSGATVAQSSTDAAINANAAPAPVIVTVGGAAGGGGGAPSTPRTSSGAVITAPVMSHMDRATFGNFDLAGP